MAWKKSVLPYPQKSTAPIRNYCKNKQSVDSLDRLAAYNYKQAGKIYSTASNINGKFNELLALIAQGVANVYPQPGFHNCEMLDKQPLSLYIQKDRLSIKPSEARLLDSLVNCYQSAGNIKGVIIRAYISKYSWDITSSNTLFGTLDVHSLQPMKLAYGEHLGSRYASNCARYLQQKGIPSDKIMMISAGVDQRYILDFMNNRLEISFVKEN